MTAGAGRLSTRELELLDADVEAALRSGDESRLAVLGGGEISLVLGWPPADPELACKRLPLFPSRARFEAYRQTFLSYLDALRNCGVDVVETELGQLEREDGTVVAYAIQPVLDPGTLAPAVLAAADPTAGHPLVETVVEAIYAVVGPRLGIDGQLSNWVWEDGRLRYLDVTTPMIWSEEGRQLLDLDLLVRALPAIARAPVKRILGPRILDAYRDRRGVANDLLGNLIKERLDAWIPAFLAVVNRHVAPPITEPEVRSYYRSDARLWEALLRIRRLDRAWQRRVRRRSYEFLLPHAVRR